MSDAAILMLLVYAGNDRYAFECDSVTEVIPKVNLKKIAHAPEYVSGLLNFRGVPVPVVDFCQMIQGRPCVSRLHTRIIILRYSGPKETPFLLGLMAERVIQTLKCIPSDFIDSGIRIKEVPFLGGVLTDKEGIIQLILLDRLFEAVKHDLFFQNESNS